MRHHHIVIAHIGIGSNLGDREKTIHHAIDLIDLSEGLAVNKVSKLIETQPVGMEPGTPPFLNGVLEVRTVLTPQDLLQRLTAIERQLGREHTGRKLTSRTIDLDILLYNNQIITDEDLVIPHPLMHERRFVLQPLAEIAPDVVHPTVQMTARGLLESLD